jgi:CspA family cold shock protein
MTIGIVKFFDSAKGYGFIVPVDGGKDIFVHKTAVDLAGMQNLTQGLRLSFETERGAKGAIQALNIKPHLDESLPGVAARNGTASGHKLSSLRPSDRQKELASGICTGG